MPEEKDIRRDVLKNRLISHVFRSFPGAFLVGGAVRDYLRGERPADLDFVVPGDFDSLAPRISSLFNGTIIKFSRDGLIRTVTSKRCLDFTVFKGGLIDDLKKRDFTINAIAWSPGKGFIDPFKGRRDIEKGIIRAVRLENLSDDPVRLIRAYRFAGELGWGIEPKTREKLRAFKNLLNEAAPERITLELFKMLSADDPENALVQAYRDGVLGAILHCNNKYLGSIIKAISVQKPFFKRLSEKYNFRFDEVFSQGLTYRGLLRFELLVSITDIAKSRLSPSRGIVKRVVIVKSLLSEFCDTPRSLDKKRLFDLFDSAGEAFFDLAILSGKSEIFKEAFRYSELKPVISARAIMKAKGIGEGPGLGEEIQKIKKLQFIGEVRSKNDAIIMIISSRGASTK